MLLAVWIAAVVSQPLRLAVDVARQVVAGDLTVDITVQSRCETGQLMQALKDMAGNLQALVARERDGTDTISTASGGIAAGNLGLSSRTEQQANALANSASAVAFKGRAVVGQVVGTMAAISASSRKIVDIIAVIDSIAFQTNILTLNAAVEAARTGEQGRGFAVVASEVRNLAQCSAAAAKDIKSLIGGSVAQVETGSRLVAEAGNTMDEIVSGIGRVTGIMADISAASLEQSTDIDKVNQAIVQMDEVTQQNAALLEQSAEAAASMKAQAAPLTEVASVFRLRGTPMRRRDAGRLAIAVD